MTSLFRKFKWWLERRRKEDDLREELEFHLSEEADDRQAEGLTAEQARQAALRDLGNVTLVREDARAVWTWTVVEQLAQDVRYALRTMIRNPAFSGLAVLTLALGIGANTAIYSFMDSILIRSLPVPDPGSLAVVKWRSRPVNFGAPGGPEFVLHSIDGSTYPEAGGVTAAIFPHPAFERLREIAGPIFTSLFAYYPAGTLNVMIHGQAELTKGLYVSGEFFHGLAVSPAAGRPLVADDGRTGADPVVVISTGYGERRFGGAINAVGQSILINNVAFTVVGVAPPEFFGVDPGAVPSLYLPLGASLLLDGATQRQFLDQNYYWLQMMGRLRPGVGLAQAQAALAGPFEQWVATTATTPRERANLPVLRLENGAGGLDTLRRQYSRPLYVLLVMVGLILAIACANTANLLLARAAARRREMAVRLSIGAGRFRLIRQLLTESVLLASLAGTLGILIAVAGIGLLTRLLANGEEGFTLHAELNWHVLLVTLGLSFLCGLVFGLAPALQSASPAVMPMLKDLRPGGPRSRVLDRFPRVSLTQALVVAQIAISLLLLIATGLFVRTLSNLQSVSLGYQRENILLFDVNAPQAGLASAAGNRLLWRAAAPPRRAPGGAARDAVACLARPGRPGASPPRQWCANTGHANAARRPRVFHDHADPAAARPPDRGARSAGSPAGGGGQRSLRPNVLRRSRSHRTQNPDRRGSARGGDRRRGGDRPIRRAQGRHPAGGLRRVPPGDVLDGPEDDLRAEHRRRPARARG